MENNEHKKKHLFHLLCWIFLSGFPKCFPPALKISSRLLFYSLFLYFLFPFFYIIIWWALNFDCDSSFNPIFLLITTQTFFTDVVFPSFFLHHKKTPKKISHWFWIIFFDTNELWPVIRKEKNYRNSLFSTQKTQSDSIDTQKWTAAPQFSTIKLKLSTPLLLKRFTNFLSISPILFFQCRSNLHNCYTATHWIVKNLKVSIQKWVFRFSFPLSADNQSLYEGKLNTKKQKL